MTVITFPKYPEPRYVAGGATAIAHQLAARCEALEAQVGLLISAQGSTWFTGDGPPSDIIGVDGDLYFDKTTLNLYQKENGTWA